MSWCISMIGTRDAVARAAAAAFDAAATQSAAGKEEARDIVATKKRALAMILTATKWNGVRLEAAGSHLAAWGGRITLEVSSVHLTLDAPPTSSMVQSSPYIRRPRDACGA